MRNDSKISLHKRAFTITAGSIGSLAKVIVPANVGKQIVVDMGGGNSQMPLSLNPSFATGGNIMSVVNVQSPNQMVMSSNPSKTFVLMKWSPGKDIV